MDARHRWHSAVKSFQQHVKEQTAHSLSRIKAMRIRRAKANVGMVKVKEREGSHDAEDADDEDQQEEESGEASEELASINRDREPQHPDCEVPN